jgi:hypothetical protein
MSRSSACQSDKNVAVACRYCGRVLETWERLATAGDGSRLARPSWRPRHVNLTRGGTARPTGPFHRSEVPAKALTLFQSLGVWPYRCHKDCVRPAAAMVTVTDAWLDAQVDGARIEV